MPSERAHPEAYWYVPVSYLPLSFASSSVRLHSSKALFHRWKKINGDASLTTKDTQHSRNDIARPEHARIVLHDQFPAWVFGANLPCDKGSSNEAETETCGEIVQSEHQDSFGLRPCNTLRVDQWRTGATFAGSPSAEPPLKKTRVFWSQGHLLPGKW